MTLKKKNILITGVAGFIGFHLSLVLLKKGYNVLGIDNLNNYYSKKYKIYRKNILLKNKKFKFLKLDLRFLDKTKKVFEKNKIDTIYHLASQPGIMYSFNNPGTYKSNNILVTKNLIHLTKKFNIEKFYFTSSSSVYGNQKKYPIKESAKLKPLNYYAKTKITCEKLLLKCLKKSEVDLKIFRPFTVYGTFSRPDMIFLTYLKRSFENNDFFLFNNGNYLRDFTHVDDVAEILYKFLAIGKIKKKIFNICSSKPVKIKDLLIIIKKYSKKNTNIILKPYRKGEMIKTYGDNRLLKKIINYKKFTSIDFGIKKTVKWYSNFKNKDILYFNKVKY
jgi:UDP-glucuronate 4-epimerase